MTEKFYPPTRTWVLRDDGEGRDQNDTGRISAIQLFGRGPDGRENGTSC